jgi:uncharacterized protein (DUF1697 family)
MAQTTFIALLRGINVTGHNRISMPELRVLAAGLGLADARTYIQSGNLVFRAAGRVADLEGQLEAAIQRQFGLKIPVIARRAADWAEYIGHYPFSAEAESVPTQVILALSKAMPKPGVVDGLRERAAAGERIVQQGDAIWIHYAGGFGRSKLTPSLLDRLAGSPVTTRNWRTVLAIAGLISPATGLRGS